MSNSDKIAIRNMKSEHSHGSVVSLSTTSVNLTGGVARIGLQTAADITSLSFRIAKFSTQLGLGVAKSCMGAVGVTTAPLDLAEFLALAGIEIGHSAASLSLHGSAELVRVIQQLFGDPFSFELAKSMVSTLKVELQRTGVEMSLLELWRFLPAWISLQKLTKELWKNEFVFPYVTEMASASDPILKVSKPVTWKKTISKTIQSLSREKQNVNTGLDYKEKRIGFPSAKEELLSLIKHFVPFAIGCYGERALNIIKGSTSKVCSSPYQFYAVYTETPVVDVIYISRSETKSDVFNSDYEPRFCLTVDHSHSTIVLAFRGTLSARDVIVDLAGEPMELELGNDGKKYFLHGGMLKVVAKCCSAEHSSKIHSRTLDLLNEYPSYSLTLTGHSLGAGIASILGIIWADPSTCRLRPDSLLPDRKVQVLAYALPSVMDENLGSLCRNLILTTVIGWDWLARISHAGVCEMRDAAINLMEAERSNHGLLARILSGNVKSQKEIAFLYEIRRQIALYPANGYKRLHPPGKILWIYKTKYDHECETFALFEVHSRKMVFGELLFDDDMHLHHMPTSYEDILSTL